MKTSGSQNSDKIEWTFDFEKNTKIDGEWFIEIELELQRIVWSIIE